MYRFFDDDARFSYAILVRTEYTNQAKWDAHARLALLVVLEPVEELYDRLQRDALP